jgi:hypothetical protein
MRRRFIGLLAAALCVLAQVPATTSVLGTVTRVRGESLEIEVKPDNAPAVTVKIGIATVAQRVAPGQTDLSKAAAINVTDVSAGDRVLVTLGAGTTEARRIIVIPANDLAKRDAADRLDWQTRGIAGVVTAISGSDIAIELRSLSGATKYTVTAGPKTTFKRYASDSVRYADAKAGSLADVSVGDQLRARGAKSADGAKVDAEDIVFGTFLSRAGNITAVNPEMRQVTIKDLGSNKPVVIAFTPDTQVKRMLDAAAMTALVAGRGAPASPATPAATPAGRGAAATPGATAGRGPDIAQMLELLPPVKLEDLKPGEIVVVSAIKGARADQITAITFLANAETLVQLAMAARGAGASGPAPSLAGLAGSIASVGP